MMILALSWRFAVCGVCPWAVAASAALMASAKARALLKRFAASFSVARITAASTATFSRGFNSLGMGRTAALLRTIAWKGSSPVSIW